jgi:hypothetical protein
MDSSDLWWFNHGFGFKSNLAKTLALKPTSGLLRIVVLRVYQETHSKPKL